MMVKFIKSINTKVMPFFVILGDIRGKVVQKNPIKYHIKIYKAKLNINKTFLVSIENDKKFTV